MLTKNALRIIQKNFENHKFDFVFGTVKRHYTKDTFIKYGFNLKDYYIISILQLLILLVFI